MFSIKLRFLSRKLAKETFLKKRWYPLWSISRSSKLAGILCFLLGPILSYSQTNSAPVVTAQGDQIYCPLTSVPIVTDFGITDPDDNEIEAFYVQISSGYQRGRDILRLRNDHPQITTSWNNQEGKLSVTGPLGGPVQYSDLISAVRDIVFESTSGTPTEEKLFSLTIGNANYLPQTGHYYEFVSDIGIRWDEARDAAEARTFFGLQGYLATVLLPEEAQLTGEQVSGAGWIGGSDAQTEGRWLWVTGPESGQVFWNGGINGSSPSFAFWNNAEPNDLDRGDGIGEDFAHITAPGIGIPGSWNDLPIAGDSSGDFQPKGYVVEYGGLPDDPVLTLSASTRLRTPRILNTVDTTLCGEGILELSAEASWGQVVWFNEPIGGNPIYMGDTLITDSISETTSFYALASVDGCLEGHRTEVMATIYPLPTVTEAITFKNCDEDGFADGFADFNLNETISFFTNENNDHGISFHLSEADANLSENEVDPLPFNNAVSPIVFARVENVYGCYGVTAINLETSTTAFPENFTYELANCDIDEQDGYSSFDLNQASAALTAQFPANQNLRVQFYRNGSDAQLELNPIGQTTQFVNENPFQQTLFVRVESEDNGDCFGIGPHLTLIVHPLTVFEVAENYVYCSGEFIEVGPINALGNYDYVWYGPDGMEIGNQERVIIDSAGQYSVVATSSLGCESEPKSFLVRESNPPALETQFIRVQMDGEVGIITVLNENQELGIGDYRFALDSPFGPFQESGVFTDVEPGLHTLYANDINGCGSDQIEVGVIGVPKFMTPNNDSINDTLGILGLTNEYYQSALLFIFDRFGQLMGSTNALESPWNGIYSGQTLPPSDYWYVLELKDVNGNGHTMKGHFTLKQ